MGLALSQENTTAAPCNPASKTFTVKLDIYTSELGYFTFEECGDVVNPTLGLEIGETYTFIQKDPSNFYHPMGFAYFPDGAHADKEELEPGVMPGNSSSSCIASLSCPAPMYMLNGEPLGTYSNDANVSAVTTGEDNFGLDDYEPRFFHPIAEWVGYGEFSIKLNFNDEDYDKDIFYFCHIHEFMSGRIKLLSNGIPVNPTADPPLGYDYQTVESEFDQVCGTWGLAPYQLPNNQCPQQFVCLDGDETSTGLDVSRSGGGDMSFAEFASCIDAMNCHMMAGMTTGGSSGSPAVLFAHQMIPHHQNAINMAKALLKSNTLQCEDLTSEEPNCVMEAVIRSIIVDQNHQIQLMLHYLEALGYPETEDCLVTVESSKGSLVGSESHDEAMDGDQETSTSTNSSSSSVLSLAFVALSSVVMGLVL